MAKKRNGIKSLASVKVVRSFFEIVPMKRERSFPTSQKGQGGEGVACGTGVLLLGMWSLAIIASALAGKMGHFARRKRELVDPGGVMSLDRAGVGIGFPGMGASGKIVPEARAFDGVASAVGVVKSSRPSKRGMTGEIWENERPMRRSNRAADNRKAVVKLVSSTDPVDIEKRVQIGHRINSSGHSRGDGRRQSGRELADWSGPPASRHTVLYS